MTTPSVKTPSRAFTYYIENLVVLSSGPLGSAFPETQGLPPVFEVKNKSEEELNELCDRSDNLLCEVLELSDANVPVLESVLHLRGGGAYSDDDDFTADCEEDDDGSDDEVCCLSARKHLKNITNRSKCSILCVMMCAMYCL